MYLDEKILYNRFQMFKIPFKPVCSTKKIFLNVNQRYINILTLRQLIISQHSDKLENHDFDIILSENTERGSSLRSNQTIDLKNKGAFYLRYNIQCRCDICFNSRRMVIPDCGHRLCMDCFDRVSTCPFCRIPYL